MIFPIKREEVQIKAVRSSGPGGQNVNKVCSKIQLRFPLEKVSFLNNWIVGRLKALFPSKVTKEGDFVLECSETRDQKENLERAFRKLEQLIEIAATPPKKRKKTRPTKASLRRNREFKEKRSEKKKGRTIKFSGQE